MYFEVFLVYKLQSHQQRNQVPELKGPFALNTHLSDRCCVQVIYNILVL
jgi:hypothetical protein